MSQRRLCHPATSDGVYDDDQVEFMLAVDAYKRQTGRMCPTWPEVLAVFRSLGYRLVGPPGPLPVHGRACRAAE